MAPTPVVLPLSGPTDGRTIQQHLLQAIPKDRKKNRAFANLMFEGKVCAALQLLVDQVSTGVLSQKFDSTPVHDILKGKHPPT